MAAEQKSNIEKLNSQFKALHNELLVKKEYELAEKFSTTYFETQTANYIAGMDYIKNLYEL